MTLSTYNLILIGALCALLVAVVLLARRLAVLRIRLETAMRNRVETTNFLNMFSKSIRKTRQTSDWMMTTARYIADLVEAQGVCIYLFHDGKRAFIPAGVSPRFPSKLVHAIDYSPDGSTSAENDDSAPARPNTLEQDSVAASLAQESLFIEDSSDPRLAEVAGQKRIESYMSVPMISDGRLVGFVAAVDSRRKNNPVFSVEQLNRLKLVSGQVMLARNILDVYDNMSEQQRINQELAFARNLQSSLLPQAFPRWGRFSIHAISRASKEVSGDFYDFVEIDKDRLLVVIGDACGKGIPACMIMAMTRSFIRANVPRFTTLKDLLYELNDNLYRDMGDGRYITLAICLLDKRQSTVEYARAGHTELLMYVHNHIRSINPNGSGLGLLPSDLTDFDTLKLQFYPQMEFLMFTDGINESENKNGQLFGVDRIKEVFLKSSLDKDPPHDTCNRIMGAVDDFSQRPNSEGDDQTVVIVTHL